MLLLFFVHLIIFNIAWLVGILCGVKSNGDDISGMLCPFIGIVISIGTILTSIEKKIDKFELWDVNFEDVIDNIIQEDDRSVDIRHKVCLSYQQFVDFYSVNPSRWELDWHHYPDRCYLRFRDDDAVLYYVYFKTGKEYKAAVKYYCEQQEKENGHKVINLNQKEKERLNKDTTALLRCVQNDINKIKSQADCEIDEATNGIKEISLRLNN